ncbi:ATP synthase F0 subcomplex subunit OSCP atp5, partial [Ceratobasidium sp. 395]
MLAARRRDASLIVYKNQTTLNKVQSELTSIKTSYSDNPALLAFVINPTLSASDRKNRLDAIFAAAAPKGSKEPVSPITRNLFEVLSENGRLGETSGVIESFNQLLSKHKGELEVVVTSASPLEKNVLTKLESTLKTSQAASQAKSVR